MAWMCLGIAGRVLELRSDHPDLARVDVEGTLRDVNVSLLDDDPARPGDWVLIHLGFALEKMTEQDVEEARSTLAILSGDGSAEDLLVGPLESDGSVSPAYRGTPS